MKEQCHTVMKIECKACKDMMFRIITANLTTVYGEENNQNSIVSILKNKYLNLWIGLLNT